MKLRLDAMREMLAATGNPHDAAPVVHVGGTNGKGSVVAFASSILRASGLRVGTYTSPHLVRLEERMLVDGMPIGDDALAASATAIRPVVERTEARHGPVTYFEALTLLAYVHFARSKVDVAVIEVGMGGRLDATNVHARPLATVVTNVSLEHTKILGSTAAAIAGEKAEIARAGTALLTAARDEALDVLRAKAAEIGSPIRVVGEDARAEILESRRDEQEILLLGTRRDYGPLTTSLVGAHQAENALLAVLACEEADARGIRVPPEAVREGVRRARWPGRLQWVRKRPALLLDGAHNPAGAEALAEFLRERALLPTTVFGCLADKDWPALVAILAPQLARVVVTAPPDARALDPRELASAFARAGLVATLEPDPNRALATARLQAGEEGTVLVTGSLYLVGHVLRTLGEPGV